MPVYARYRNLIKTSYILARKLPGHLHSQLEPRRFMIAAGTTHNCRLWRLQQFVVQAIPMRD